MNQDDLALIHRKALSVARVWPDVCPDDLNNELVAKWLEHSEAVERYQQHEDPAAGERLLDKTLGRWAWAWCRQETAAIRGHDDFARYTREQIKHMLPFVHTPEVWGSLAATGATGRSGKPASEGGDTLAVYADLRAAWGHLSADEQELLDARWVRENPRCFDEWAAVTGRPANTYAKRCSRALDRFEQLLAGRPKYEGARRHVMSNAAAQSVTGRNY